VKLFWKLNSTRRILLILIFIIGPAALYVFLIHPPLQRITEFENQVIHQPQRPFLSFFNVVNADDQELEHLKTIKQDQLARIKKIDTRESLLQFNNILADALALQARRNNLQVVRVDMENPLIAGRYIPDNDRALSILESMPGTLWNEISDPLAVPMLSLPFIEIRITVSGAYSRVFSYIESLVDFPSRILLTDLSMVEGAEGKNYSLGIRGYYYSLDNMEHLAQTEPFPESDEALFE
jgi:hypothetical protein